MNMGELIEDARDRFDDHAIGELVSETRFKRFANEAEKQACMRASLLYDDRSSFLQFALAPGVSDYKLDRRVLRLTKVEFQATGSTRWREVELTGVDRLNRVHHHLHDSECTVIGAVPTGAAHVARYTLRLWPTPSSASGIVRLSCYRLPLRKMSALDDCPEIELDQHDGLVDWMVYRATQPSDQDIEDVPRSRAALDDFEKRYGELPSAEVLRRHNERRRVTARYGGF